MSASGQTKWVPWDVSDGIKFLGIAECPARSVLSAGPLRRTQAAVPLHSTVHMFAVDLKYRCIHYVSEHSCFNTFKLVSPNMGDLPQVQRQMSRLHTCLHVTGADLPFSLSWLPGSCQIWKCFWIFY